MEPNKSPHPIYRYYLCLVILVGIAATAYCGFQAFRQDPGYGWIILASLTALTGPFTIKIPGAHSKISVAETFIITNLLLFGPAIGCITAGLDGLVGSLRCKTKSRRPQYALFNIAVMALSAFVSGETFVLFGGKPMVHLGRLPSLDNVWLPLGCLVMVYYLINTASVAVIIGLERRQNIVRVWRKNFLWLGANYLTAGTTAGLLSLVAREVTPATVVVILTMLASSYIICSSHCNRANA